MRFSGWLWLVRREVAAQPGRAVLLVLCAGLACGICGIAFHGLRYVRMEFRPHLESLFPEERLVVRPGEVDVAFFRMRTRGIDDDMLARIAALDGVARAHPQMTALFPVMAEISIGRLDVDFASDVVLFGVPEDLVRRDLPAGAAFAFDPSGARPVPVVVSAYFLDMYNLGLAEGSGLPKLSAAAAIGREFDLTLGESSVGLASRGRPRTVRARIVGLVRDPLLTGLCVPVDAMRAWNGEYAPGTPPSYGIVHVDAADSETAKVLADKLAAMGLSAALPSDTMAKFAGIASSIEGMLAAGVAAILALATTAVFATAAMAARERRAVWGLHRAAGLGPGALLSLVAGEALLLAVPSCAMACGIAAGAVLGARAAFGEWLDGLAVIPANPLALQPSMLLATAILCAAMVAAPLAIFAVPAMRREPADLLAARAV